MCKLLDPGVIARTFKCKFKAPMRPGDEVSVEMRIVGLVPKMPLGMRLAGYCLLHLRSSDASFETVILYRIPNLEQLADTLRECSLRERSRRRVTTFVQA